ncbi:MAG: tetratricopeptide repeat protein [Candidatus Hodarchaeales archaeon]|jgi:tetratricopeptide (TPR) repeat protein
MLNSATKDLRHAENLRREGKLQEALEVIETIEKKGTLTPGDQLSLLISKGKILTIYQRYGETANLGKLAYHLSKTLRRPHDTIYALLFQASSLFLGEPEESLNYLSEADNLLDTLSDISISYFNRQKKNILFKKSWAHLMKFELNKALETALECLELQNEYGYKSDTGYTLQVLGSIYHNKGDNDLAFDYASKSLTMLEEIGDQAAIATTFHILGRISHQLGDLNHAIEYSKKSLSSKIINNNQKLDNMILLGGIYSDRGELDKALRYYKQGIALSQKENYYNRFINIQTQIGEIYLLKGEYDLALEILEPSLSLAEEMNFPIGIALSLTHLLRIHLDRDEDDIIEKYLERFKKYEAQWENKTLSNSYRLLKAAALINKGGSHNRVEAATLLKKLVMEETYPTIKAISLIYLSEFYLEELKLFEDTEVLKNLNPLVTQLYSFSEEQHMYGYLAEAKLLQAKLALIQMDFEEAQRLLTQAQRVAELYGITRTAQKISGEHDNYLEKLNDWKNLKERDAPISERLKLASVDIVLESLQGKRTMEPPELVEEEPIVLLIIDKSGISYFNYPFKEDWDFEWIFSSFMSAFDTFSSEVFSESIDRIKIGENLILVNPIESFLVCYVIKGQSYLGLQKLNRFSKAIKDNTEIWESLNRAVKTGEVLELDNPRSLRNIISEIFT